MRELAFRNFVEALADFGVDRPTHHPEAGKRPEKENPIDTFDIERMRDMMVERELGELLPVSRFVNEVVWGGGPGSIKMWVDPKTGVYIDRLGTDLEGVSRWYTKKYVQINRHGYGGFEETVANEIFDFLEAVQRQQIDSPKRDYTELKSLTLTLAERLRREARPIFVFDGVRQMNENRYLILFNVRGHGLQAPGQVRVEKNVTDVNFYPGGGYIRVINNNYQSPLGEHKWEVGGPDLDCVFFPTQDREEIVSPVVTNLRFY